MRFFKLSLFGKFTWTAMAIICYIYCLAFLASHRIHRTFVRISNIVGATNRKILIGAKLRTFCKTFDRENHYK